MFDPVSSQKYTKIPFETINSESAQASSLQAAIQSLVLLKNGKPGSPVPTPFRARRNSPLCATRAEI